MMSSAKVLIETWARMASRRLPRGVVEDPGQDDGEREDPEGEDRDSGKAEAAILGGPVRHHVLRVVPGGPNKGENHRAGRRAEFRLPSRQREAAPAGLVETTVRLPLAW